MKMLIQIGMGYVPVLILVYYIANDESDTGYKISQIDRCIVNREAA